MMTDGIKEAIQGRIGKQFEFGFDPANPSVKLHEPSYGVDEIMAYMEPMLSTFVTMGKEVKGFERKFADYFGSSHSVMCNSGSSANLLAISTLCNPTIENGLRPGDEVLVPALCWSTSVFPLIQNGLVPVLIDCDPDTFNMDLDALESAINERTRGILLIHVYGNPLNMERLMQIARANNLHVIEDTCEAMGAKYNGQFVGTFGDIGTHSLYFSHHITTIEGGVCVTNNFEYSELMRILRAHGWSREAENHEKYVKANPTIDPRYIFVNLGYNLRPTESQGKMGQIQVDKLSGFVQRRREVCAGYQERLGGLGDYFRFQQETPNGESSWFGYSLVLKEGLPFTVNELGNYLRERGVENRPLIAGNIEKHPVMQMFDYKVQGELKHATWIMDNALSIGCHQYVDPAAIDYVGSVIEGFLAKYGKPVAG